MPYPLLIDPFLYEYAFSIIVFRPAYTWLFPATVFHCRLILLGNI